MSDAVAIAIVGAVPLTLAAIGGITGAYFSYKAAQLAAQNHTQAMREGKELKTIVNGRMDQMLEAARESGKVEGAAAAGSPPPEKEPR